MKNKKQITEEVEKTLNLLDKMPEIEVDPFFYTRLQAKLRSGEQKESAGMGWEWNLASLRNTSIILLVVLNFISGWYVWQQNNASYTDRETYISTLTEEYSSGQTEYITNLK